jgi:hypothetical protein
MRKRDVAEIDHAVGGNRDAFREHDAAIEDLFELGAGRDDFIFSLTLANTRDASESHNA